MATNDLQRAETLANLFAAPATPVPVPAPSVMPAVPAEPVAKTRRALAVVEDAAGETAVAEAVGVMETVITMPVDDEADDMDEAANAVEHEALADTVATVHGATPAADTDLVSELTTKMGLKGAADRHNIPVSEATGNLLKALDKQLATSGRPVVSRNALITAAARKVIADPAAYASAPGRDPSEPSSAIQGRVPAGLPADLRAAAYSVEPPLVVAHAMAAAATELLEELQTLVKKGKHTPRRT
jgi:hypothetical protein